MRIFYILATITLQYIFHLQLLALKIPFTEVTYDVPSDDDVTGN